MLNKPEVRKAKLGRNSRPLDLASEDIADLLESHVSGRVGIGTKL